MKRISRQEQIAGRKYLRNITISIVGIIIILIFFIFFGIPLLINLSLFSENFRSPNDTEISEENTINLAPPVIDPLPEAVKENKIDITGYALSADQVILYLNNKMVEETVTNDDGKFSFKKIILKEGKNTFKAKSLKSSNRESNFTRTITVIYKKNPPSLQIDSPSDNTEIDEGKSNRLEIKGKTEPDTRITINNFWAIVDDEGNFSYLFNLNKGENKIIIKAIDAAGNTTEKEIKVIKK